MLRVLIIDDEKKATEVLQLQISNYCKDIDIVGVGHGGEEGVELILSLKPDLVLLDIEMPFVNGFDVLERTKQITYQVIFTTAYSQFAVKAFKFAALDYLLKPIDIVELQQALAAAQTKMSKVELESKVNLLWEHLHAKESRSRSISLPIGNALEIIDSDDIIRCESDNTYTYVFLNSGKKITVAKTLKEVDEKLTGLDFVRLHKSHLVNMNYISTFHKEGNAYVTLKNKEMIPVSRNKKNDFMQKFRSL
jgi:two-component system LytT family response regulator